MVRAALVAVCLLGAGCAAQSEFYDDRDWTREKGAEEGAWREVESLGDEASGPTVASGADLPSVRHDLSMAANAKADVRCNCVDVAIGRPADPRFLWAGDEANISGMDMVVAFRTQTTNCRETLTLTRRPSIQAVDTSGNDVVVVIEELPAGRPQALGAIVRRPGPRGRLFVRPRYRHLPYGRSYANATSCYVTFGDERARGGPG
jgi:hypothetical protein